MTEGAGAIAFSIGDVVSAIKTVLTPFLENLTVGNIAQILAIVILASLTLYVFYWGVRKGLRMVQGAFTKGKLRI